MRGYWVLSALLVISTLFFSCGRIRGKDELNKDSNTAGLGNPSTPEGAAAGAPPAYVSHTRINPTLLEVTLTKELTDASATNTVNY
ncbi:MAG: hypothetical protein N2Z22_08770, partial [Turneriella sp.]|nr:hypothetical protein [Turneriella sp.]